MNFITPILLAGGSGTRLWPLSRKTYPKQFAKLASHETLFQQSALRFISSDVLQFKPHITVTNELFCFIVSEQLQSIGIDLGSILIEPEFGLSINESKLRRVDFPDPDGPIKE